MDFGKWLIIILFLFISNGFCIISKEKSCISFFNSTNEQYFSPQRVSLSKMSSCCWFSEQTCCIDEETGKIDKKYIDVSKLKEKLKGN